MSLDDGILSNRIFEAGPFDEIGKMECHSRLFREALVGILDSPNPVLASIALKGNSFIEKIKERKDVALIRVAENNRDSLPEKLIVQIREISAGGEELPAR